MKNMENRINGKQWRLLRKTVSHIAILRPCTQAAFNTERHTHNNSRPAGSLLGGKFTRETLTAVARGRLLK